MSDYANSLLKAIASGDEENMNTSFYDAINVKISDAIDAKRIELAQSLYGDEVNDTEYESETSDDDTEEV